MTRRFLSLAHIRRTKLRISTCGAFCCSSFSDAHKSAAADICGCREKTGGALCRELYLDYSKCRARVTIYAEMQRKQIRSFLSMHLMRMTTR